MMRMSRSARALTMQSMERVFADSGHEYSAERLFAFCEYCERTSPLRVFLVLVLNLSVPLLVLAVYDLVPLQNPDAGWSANSSFWVRTFVNVIFVCGGIMLQAPLVIPDVRLTLRRMVIIVAGVCVGYTGSLMLLASVWVFPVPFMFTVGGIPFCTSLALFAVLTLGTADRAQLWAFVRFSNNIAVQTSMMVVYPTYNALFLRLKGPAQLAFVLVLPVMKYSFKLAISKVQAADVDLLPAILSSVDIFDALYMTKCMQSAGSIEVGFGIILIDVAQNLLAMHGIARQTRTLRVMFAHQESLTSQVEPMDASEHDKDASPFFRFLMRHVRQLDAKSLCSLRFPSSPRLAQSAQSQRQLSWLRSSIKVVPANETRHDSSKKSAEATGSNNTSGDSDGSAKGKMKRSSVESVAVVAPLGSLAPTWIKASQQQQLVAGSKQLATHSENEPEHPLIDETERIQSLVRESARLLHESEAVGVIEYIETVVPIFYALYILFLFRLPNAKYYGDMRMFTTETLHAAVVNILMYSLMELLSLAWVHRMLQRSFGISLFYQLAFTLEREWRLFQCNFVSWILVVFQFLLLHNGSDYSFMFKWMNGDSVFSHTEHGGNSTNGSGAGGLGY